MLVPSNNGSELPQSSWCTLESIAYAVASIHTPGSEIPLVEIFNNLQQRLDESFYTTITSSGPIQLFNRHGVFNTTLINENILGVYQTLDWLLNRYEIQYNINVNTTPESTLNLLYRFPNLKIVQFTDVKNDEGKIQREGHTIVLQNTNCDKDYPGISIFDPHLQNLHIIPKEDLQKGEIVSGDNKHTYVLTPATIIFHGC